MARVPDPIARGTPIRRFSPGQDTEPDIGPIHSRPASSESHIGIDGEATTMILIHAELFHRYPATVVLAAPAETNPQSRQAPSGGTLRARYRHSSRPVDGSTRASLLPCVPSR